MMEKLRILIVEDESIVAMDIQHRLNSYGYQVIGHVVNGKNAILEAGEKKPDCILMDIQLKGEMDGIETAEIIRMEFDIPIIFLTAYADRATLERAKLTEAFGYILKPYHERELYTNIEMAIYKHQMERKLRESKQWLYTTLNSITDGVLAADVNGEIFLTNSQAAGLTGLPRDELIGKTMNQLFDGLIKKVDEQEKEHEYPFFYNFIKRKDKNIPIEMTETELKDEKSKKVGKVVVLHDISQRYAYENALRQAKINAEKASAAKSDFLATISHELRTPLNSILGMAEISLDLENLPQEIEENLKIIEKSGKTLLTVINSMLQLSSVDSKMEMEEQISEFSLAAFAENMVNTFGQQAARRDIKFTCTVKNGVPQKMIGSEPFLLEIAANIIENALKFTSKGKITVSIEEEKKINIRPDIWLHFIISDTGKGLSEENKEKIFEPFSQEESIYTRHHGGAGLGLTIAKQKIEMAGGDIWVESRKQEGCTFHFILPFSVPEDKSVFNKDLTLNNGVFREIINNGCESSQTDLLKTFTDKIMPFLENDDFESIEELSKEIKERLELTGTMIYKEIFLKILLAVRREDKDAILHGVEELTKINNECG